MHLLSTKEVLCRLVPTFKREKPFLTVLIPTCEFCGRDILFSGYHSNQTSSKSSKAV